MPIPLSIPGILFESTIVPTRSQGGIAMLLIGIIAAAVFVVILILIIEKRGDPDYLERLYKVKESQRDKETKKS